MALRDAAQVQAIDWLFVQQERGIHPGLERMRALLGALGHPEQGLQVLQVAGTNGKGSVTRLVTTMLEDAAKLEPSFGPVGEYTSPHLHRFAERIRVNGLEIPDEALERHIKHLQAIHVSVPATFFELVTALALLHFQASQVRWAVLEVGLGGRLDATSTVPAKASAITTIGLDHTQILGETLEQIAFEKAGIIRGCVPVVTSAQGVALRVIEARAEALGAPCWALGRELTVQTETLGLEGQRVQVCSPAGTLEVQTRLLGAHQVGNIAVAVAVAQRIGLPNKAIQSGAARAQWPGRLEFVPGEPQVLLDAAHNPQGAQALAEFVQQVQPGPVTLMVAGLADKDLAGVAAALRPIARHVIATKPSFAVRAADPAAVAARYPNAQTASDPAEALRLARQITPNDGLILVAGTIPLIAEIRELLHGLTPEAHLRSQ